MGEDGEDKTQVGGVVERGIAEESSPDISLYPSLPFLLDFLPKFAISFVRPNRVFQKRGRPGRGKRERERRSERARECWVLRADIA